MAVKILHVLNIFFAIPPFLGEQLSYFQRLGAEEHLICAPSPELQPYCRRHGHKGSVADIRRAISPFADIKAIWTVFRYIRREKIDLVTGHTPKGGMVAMIAAWLARCPRRIYFRHGLVYETAHGLKRSLLVNIDRLTSRLATKVVCVSPSLASQSLTDKLCPARKQIVLGSGTCTGIDTARFSPRSVTREFGLTTDNFVIGFVGRFVHDKGIPELLQAFEIIQSRCPHARLMLVGQSDTRDDISDDLKAHLKNNPGIIITGIIPFRKIHLLYNQMDCLVLPSRREGFPLCVMEGAASGIPTVTTRTTGCVDSIVEKETGLFADLTPQDLAEKLLILAFNPELRLEMGRKARQRAVDEFAQEGVWAEILNLYRSLGLNL